MSGFSMRGIALSLTCVLALALPAEAQRGGGGHGIGRGGGGGAPAFRGGGGGGGARFSAPAMRSFGGGGGGARFSAPAVRSFGGGGGARFSAPAVRSFGGGGAVRSFGHPRAFTGRSFGGRSFSGVRTFSRPTVGARSFSRPGVRGSRFVGTQRMLHGGRVLRSGRYVTSSRVSGRSARIGTRALSHRRGLAGQGNLARRGLAARTSPTDRRVGGRGALANRGGLAGRAALGTGRLGGANAARIAGLHRSGRHAAAHNYRRHDWHRHWRQHRTVYYGWVGPVFWPYAYDDLFYDAFWGYGPYAAYDYYEDPFWSYGYADIYGGLFSPYTYDDLAVWASAPARTVRTASRATAPLDRGGERTDTTASVPSRAPAPHPWAAMCGDDTRDVVGLPIDRIQEVVKPDETQRAALDRLGNASINAAQAIKASCPADYSLTPTGRLAAMEHRLQGVRLAVDIMRPALEDFYGSLTDEQKARFNAAGQRDRPAGERRSFAQDCGAASPAADWPTERIDRMVRPTPEQRAGLEQLREAAAKAGDMLKSACPTETLTTPPARLAAMSARLDVMIEAVRTVKTALDRFYASLTDEQKAQFNTIGQARAAR